MKKITFLSFIFLLLCGNIFAQKASDKYKNSNLPIAERVKDLLKKMTLEEKVAQTQCHWETLSFGIITSGDGKADYTKLAKFAPNGLGQLARPNELPNFGGLSPYETAKYANDVQKYFVLDVPVFEILGIIFFDTKIL